MRMGLVQIYRPCERPVPLHYKIGYMGEEGTERVNEMTLKPNTHNHYYEIWLLTFFSAFVYFLIPLFSCFCLCRVPRPSLGSSFRNFLCLLRLYLPP